MMPRESLRPPLERESFEDEMAALNVPIERPKAGELTGVKWVERNQPLRTKILGVCVRVSRNLITIGPEAAKILGAEGKTLLFGVGDLNGQKVLLLRPSVKGFAMQSDKSGGLCNKTPSAIKRLMEAGLVLGMYELKQPIKGGGYAAVPVEAK